MKSAIYLIRSTGKTKIGYSKNPWRRYKQLCTGQPNPMALIFTLYCHDAAAMERALHKEFQDRRGHGEWFSVEIHEILAKISVMIKPDSNHKPTYIESNNESNKVHHPVPSQCIDDDYDDYDDDDPATKEELAEFIAALRKL